MTVYRCFVKKAPVFKTGDVARGQAKGLVYLFKESEFHLKAAEVEQWRFLHWEVTAIAVASRIGCVNTCRMGGNC